MTGPGGSLRTVVGPPALLLHIATWFAVLAHGHDWVGSWTDALDQVAGSVVIVGPLLAGLVANTYSRRAETSLAVLVATSCHPARGWYEPVLRLWALATANLLVVAAEVLVVVALAGPRVSARPLLILPVCVLVLAVHAALGLAVGVRLRPRLAGAVAGTASFALFLLAVAGLAPAAFVIGGSTGGLVGEQYRLTVLLTLALVAALSLLAGVAATGWNAAWPRTRAIGAVSTIALAMWLSRGGITDLDHRFEAASVPLRCQGSAPEVCLPADAPRALPAAARALHRLSAPLREAGVELPERWVDYWGQPADRKVGVLSFVESSELGTRVDDRDIAPSLSMPATCPAYFDGREPTRSLNARLLLQNWIAFRNGLGDTEQARPWFSSARSETWVRTTYPKLRRCDLAEVILPASAP